MPTYEYKCDACGHGFEKFQSITAAAITKCPECGKNKVRRLIGAGAGLIFKGSGFYITDYRSDGYKSAAKGDSSSSSSTSTTSSSTGGGNGSAKAAESKPASSGSKSETKSS